MIKKFDKLEFCEEENTMADMLVKLFDITPPVELEKSLLGEGIRIKRAIAPDKSKIEEFAKRCASEDYSDEVSVALSTTPTTCYIATKGKELVGFACFEATSKNFFGPMAVLKEYRRKGIGKVLLLKSLVSMQEMGYAYAIIGWPTKTAIPFYEKCVNAILIHDESYGLYSQMIEMNEW